MKNRVLAIIVLSLVAVIVIAQFVGKDNVLYPLNFNKSNNTLNEELSNFAVKNIKEVDKIFITDKQNNQVTLDKTEEGWKVNQHFFAREDAIKNLLQCLQKMTVKHPISKAEHNTQIQRLAVSSRKVEVYAKGKKIKTMYIGGATQDQYGTYAILENSSVPFVVHIQGFLGFLTPRFIVTEDLWRENFVFKCKPANITKVQVVNSEEKEKSFTLTKMGNAYSIKNYKGQSIRNIDTAQVKFYLSNFKKISYEAMVTEMTEQKRDSLINKAKPFHTITLEAGKDNRQVIKTFHVKNDTHYNDEGEMLLYDPDRMYAVFNNNKDIATVQYRTFDKITIDPKLFFSK